MRMGMKQLVLFLLHFFWLCYTMKEKQTHSEKADTPRPHICKVAVELLRCPDSILYPFKHRCFYIYIVSLLKVREKKPSADLTLGGIFKPTFLARSTGESISLVLLYIVPNENCLMWRTGSSPVPAHGQWIWYPFCVTAGACKGQEIRSQPGPNLSRTGTPFPQSPALPAVTVHWKWEFLNTTFWEQHCLFVCLCFLFCF